MHETIMRTRVICKEISCILRDSAYGGLLLKMLKYFKVTLKVFEFFHVKEILES